MDDGSATAHLRWPLRCGDARASVELHMLPQGGHGYGMYPAIIAAETWPKLLEVWLKEHL
jgi:hypothetical protein